MAFANVIRTLRRAADMTQDELAEALGITSQAVSRWETGAAIPDVSTIVKLSYFFGVTTDHLLEADSGRTEQEIHRILAECDTLTRDGKPENAVTVLRDTLGKYPKHLLLTRTLGHTLEKAAYRTADPRKKKKLREEAITMLEDVLTRLTEEKERVEVIHSLFYTCLDAGYRDKAAALAEMLAHNPDAQAPLKIELAEGWDKIRLMQEQAHRFYSRLNWQVYLLATQDELTPAQKIAMLEAVEKAGDALFPEDARNLRCSEFFHCAWQLSMNCSELGDVENGILWLGRMAESAIAEERYKEETKVPLKSPVFDGFALTKKPGGWDCAWVLDVMGDSCYDNLRADPRFEEIRCALEAARGE